MAKLHGPDWETSIRSVHTWMEGSSPFYLPQETRRALVNGEKMNVFFVNGNYFFKVICFIIINSYAGTEASSEPFDLGK